MSLIRILFIPLLTFAPLWDHPPMFRMAEDVRHAEPGSNITSLPLDILISLMDYLHPLDLVALRKVHCLPLLSRTIFLTFRTLYCFLDLPRPLCRQPTADSMDQSTLRCLFRQRHLPPYVPIRPNDH